MAAASGARSVARLAAAATPKLRRTTGIAALTVGILAGCSSDEESACDRLRDRLHAIEAEADGLTEQSWENVLRGHELQAERTGVRRQLVDEGCTVDT